MRRLIFVLAMTLLFAVGLPLLASASTATTLVKETSEQMLEILDARRDEIEGQPELIYGLVERIILPHFDFERITQGAVGRYWREATPAQRDELINGFREVLVRTYARALLSYSGQAIQYLPERSMAGGERVTVSTEVQDRGGAVIAVDYRLYRRDGDWKVYDLVIDRVSMVANYRGSFASIIRRNGIDGLVDRLGEMNLAGQG